MKITSTLFLIKLLFIKYSLCQICINDLKQQCLDHGKIYPAYDNDCQGFWICSNGTAYLRCCNPGTVYHPMLKVCVPQNKLLCNTEYPNIDPR